MSEYSDAGTLRVYNNSIPHLIRTSGIKACHYSAYVASLFGFASGITVTLRPAFKTPRTPSERPLIAFYRVSRNASGRTVLLGRIA